MQADSILRSDILDIIFESRNKMYGAYALRKDYSGRLVKSFGLMLFFIAVILVFFITGNDQLPSKMEIPDTRIVSILPNLPEKIKEIVPIAEKPKQNQIVKKVNTQLYISNMQLVNDRTQADRLPINLDSSVISNSTHQGLPGNIPMVNIPAGPISSSTTNLAFPGKTNRDVPVSTAEVMPAFPGGMDALRKFLERNLVTPEGIQQGDLVSVKVTFVVGYDGGLKGFEVTENGGEEFNQEVIRVLKMMPRWIPGKTNGEAISVYYTIPVKFVSQE